MLTTSPAAPVMSTLDGFIGFSTKDSIEDTLWNKKHPLMNSVNTSVLLSVSVILILGLPNILPVSPCSR